ncbi:hypothetical protein H1R20_g11920, partial [Candolleomyces eurysporus]
MASNICHIQESSGRSTAETLVERREFSIDHKSFKTPQAAKPIHKTQTLPPVIPPTHQNRTLVLCFDGTGDQFDGDNSNVVQFVSLLMKEDHDKQLVYYQTGIGTYTAKNRTISPLISQLQRILNTMFADTIDAHIMGFSRGAYTARCLASMLYIVGLLPPNNSEQVSFAYTIFRRNDDFGRKQADDFKRAFSTTVNIEFLGVWDTVGSVGFIPEKPPFTTSTAFIKTYRHAMSLDERRAKFQANPWNKHLSVEEEPEVPTSSSRPPTDIKEVWFAGCHSGPAAMLDSEEHEELKDALSPIYDRMNIRKWWWLLEYIPLPLRRVRNGQITTRLGFNLGKPRVVESPILHRSVKMRMEAKYTYKKYEPEAKLPDSEKPTWVD